MTSNSNSLATQDSPWKDASFFINGEPVQWNSPGVGLRRGQSNDFKVNAPGLNGTQISLGLVNDEGLDIEANPAFDAWVSIVDDEARWTLTPADKSGRVKLVLISRQVPEFLEFPCWVLSSNLADEVDATMGSSVVPIPEANKVFWPSLGIQLNLRAKPGSPIAGFPLELKVEVKSPGLPDPVTSRPPVMTLNTSHQWVVSGVAGSEAATFDLVLSGQGMTPLKVTDCTMHSANLLDYATITVGGDPIPADGAQFYGGKTQTLQVVPKTGSPPLPALNLSFRPLEGNPNQNYFKFEPGLGFPNPDFSWEMTCQEFITGKFELITAGSGTTARVLCRLNR